MNTPANAATASGIDKNILADLDKAASIGGAGDTFSSADLPAQSTPPQHDPAMAGMISGALVVTFNLLAKQRGEHWAIDADSADQAGAAYAIVIQKHFPAFQGGPEFTAVMLTVALVAPRVLMDKANAAIEADRAQGASDGAQSE